MKFTHNEHYLVSGDDNGRIKYWKPNLELLNESIAHRETVRSICFSSTDLKFCTCSDDATLKIWDFKTCIVNKIFSGHGADVKFVDWHPEKSLVASCSKDSQIKLWSIDEKKSISTFYGHKSAINQIFWNKNGNWLLTCSRDQVCKVKVYGSKINLKKFKLLYFILW